MNNLTHHLKTNILLQSEFLSKDLTLGRIKTKIIHTGNGLGSTTSDGFLELDHSMAR